jgi:hypothetical protein
VFRLRRKEGAFVYEGKDGGGAPFDRAAAAAKAESVFLGLLNAFETQGRKISPNRSSNYAPSVYENEPGAEGVSRAAFTHAMSRLLNERRIHIVSEGPPSRRRERLKPGPSTEIVQ